MNDSAVSLPQTVPTRPEAAKPGDSSPAVTAMVYDLHRTVGDGLPPAQVNPPDLPQMPGYVLEKELGRGGMGVVYRARQMPLNRVVALKMILSGDHASDETKRRFLAEAEAIAHVQHPGIVQVHEFGTHHNNPYFALEYVEGGSLDRVLAKETLLPQRAAMLVAQLAHAVHAAHQAGIVHRDLKPANILLAQKFQTPTNKSQTTSNDQNPKSETKHPGVSDLSSSEWGLVSDFHPKVTDFGLAKLLDAEGSHTVSGAIMGTPSYMAPEQAAGNVSQINPTTDVYALGAILYECLTGRPPFKGATLYDTLEMVQRQEPVAVRQLQPKTPKDLETVCHKCLHKEQSKRYGSAAALAEDLRNWLDGKPISARPVGRFERSVKWCRRYPAVTALIVVSVFAALVASGLAWWAITAEREALAERDAKEVQRQLAVAAEERSYWTFEKLTGPDTLKFLRTGSAHLTPDQKAFLEEAAAYFREVAAKAGTDEKGRARTASAQMRLGYMLSDLGRKPAAVEAYRAAVALFEALVRDFPAVPEYRQYLAQSHHNLGLLQEDLGKRVEAEGAYRAGLALQEALVRDFPAAPEYRQELATSHNHLGLLLAGLGKRDEAGRAYRLALALQQALVRDFPAVPTYRQDLAQSHNNLGLLLADLGKRGEAEEAYQTAIALKEALVHDFPTVPTYRQDLAHSHLNLGNLLAGLGKRSEAAAAYRAGLALLEVLVRDFPAVPTYRLGLAKSHHNLGNLLASQGNWSDAEGAYRAALALREALVRDFPAVPEYRLDLALSHTNLGNLLANLGKRAEAERAYRAGLALLEALVRDFPAVPTYRLDLAGTYSNLGSLLASLGKRKEAEGAYRAGLALLEALVREFPAVPTCRQKLAGGYVNFGLLVRDQGRPAEALDWYAQALPLLEANLRQEPRSATDRLFLRNAHWGRANALADLGRFAETAAAWDLVLTFNDQTQGAAIIKSNRTAAVIAAGLTQDYVWILLWSWPW